MGVKRMYRYWSPEGILVENDDLLILKNARESKEYDYFIRMQRANVELCIHVESINGEFLNDPAMAVFERRLAATMIEMQDELENKEPLPQKWGKSK